MKTIEAKIFSLVPKDFLKALIMAGLVAAGKLVYTSIQAGTFPMDAITWMAIGKAAGVAMVAYLLKNLLTNSNDQFLKAEPKDAPAK
jgi:hypothetical protein